MKIGIMSFPNMTSYGCTLQMYSLYRAVENLGADAEIINYQNRYMKSQRHTSAVRNRGPFFGHIRLAAVKALHLRQIAGFRRFEHRMDKYPSRPAVDPSRLSALAGRYDSVICGSDQVWNPLINGEDLSFFLNFCKPPVKRIAYAPSFGVSLLPEAYAARIYPELKQFSHLSVREKDGAQLVEAMLDRPVAEVLDPTFLTPPEEWSALEQEHPMAKGSPYIFCFPVRKSEELIVFSRELAEKRNARLIIVQGNLLTRLRNRDPRISYALDLSPGEWLYLMHHADCIVTNSFHGAAFAIHYQKDFYLECSSKANSRLYNLMSLCGLEQRIISNAPAPQNSQIDYRTVEEKLAPVKAASLQYLKQAILS